MNLISLNRFKIRLMYWLLAVWSCVLLVVCAPSPAFATVTQIEEYPGQMLYQSRQTLQDQTGNSWQMIVFKRVHPEGSAAISLRLIGFANGVEFNHTQPLTLTTSTGKTLTARDISNEISQSTSAPANVGEYDLQSVAPQLKSEIPLYLTLPMVTGSSIELKIPFAVVQEWQAILTR